MESNDRLLQKLQSISERAGLKAEDFQAALDNGTLYGVFHAIANGQQIVTMLDDESLETEAEGYLKRLRRVGLKGEPRTVVAHQINRLRRLGNHASEAETIRNYIEWILALPWSHYSQDQIDLLRAKRILDEDHSYRKAIKDRVVEHLAVLRLTGTTQGSVLCFVGPPGTGKTSFGRSIARAMGRTYGRISLGGINDEAEIRGHRRTYVGSLPGRIVQALKSVGTANPVFVLDEIDKLSTGGRGDPTAALLEALDPEQNQHFSDHYLSIPFDLSKVLFIATANELDPIPQALRDRLEVIEVAGYTLNERIGIAEKHLLKKQMRLHGIPQTAVRWSRDAFGELATHYAQEQGVRNLERQIAAICRKMARRIVEGKTGSRTTVNKHMVQRLLGPPRSPRSSVRILSTQPTRQLLVKGDDSCN